MLLPELSKALLVTVVVPSANALPLAGVLIILVTAQLSVAVTTKVTLLTQVPVAALTMMFVGQVITGSWVSRTVTVKVHWLLLPTLSKTVLVTMVVPTANALPLDGTLTMLATPQLSAAVTLNVTLLEHAPGAALTVIFAGQVIVGGVVSTTVTVKVHWLLLPAASRAVLVTMVVPAENVEALAGVLTRLVTPQLSVAVTVKLTLRVHPPPVGLTEMFAGQVIAGGCASRTVTVNVHWLLLPELSNALLVTVVVPTANAEPLAGVLTRLVTEQLSVAFTLNVTLLAQAPVAALTVTFVGQVITGSWVSPIVTVNVHWLLLPELSNAWLVTVVVPTANALPLAGVLTILVTAQLSVALTTKVTLLTQVPVATLTMMFDGQVSTGNCVSRTVTVNVHWLLLPELSKALLVTMVVPMENALPLAGTLTRLVTAQLSVAVTLNVTLLEHAPGAALTVMFAGQVSTGSCASRTVTVNVH